LVSFGTREPRPSRKRPRQAASITGGAVLQGREPGRSSGPVKRQISSAGQSAKPARTIGLDVPNCRPGRARADRPDRLFNGHGAGGSPRQRGPDVRPDGAGGGGAPSVCRCQLYILSGIAKKQDTRELQARASLGLGAHTREGRTKRENEERMKNG